MKQAIYLLRKWPLFSEAFETLDYDAAGEMNRPQPERASPMTNILRLLQDDRMYKVKREYQGSSF